MKLNIVASLVAAAAMCKVQASPVGGLPTTAQQAVMDALVAAAEVSAKAALVSQYAQVASLNSAAGIKDPIVLEQISNAQAQVLGALASQYDQVGSGNSIVDNAGSASPSSSLSSSLSSIPGVAIATEIKTVTGSSAANKPSPSRAPLAPSSSPIAVPPVAPVVSSAVSIALPTSAPKPPAPTPPPTPTPPPAPSQPAPPKPQPTSAAPPVGGGGGTFKGQGTYYTPGLGSCGKTNTDSDLIAAINAPQYGVNANPNNAEVCGKCALVTGPKGQVKVTITDRCPVCAHGDLDLSPTAFDKIGLQADGRISISWSFVPC
ncbi:hypothetical protein LPJ61_004982 [Coemansia biformis]|uniref:RlpA-like protein double-psi beta-barrel domain-containing protein n=1 Tax=Coemansia biformis TaxID=1286918 RepID=A0A9W8CU67_9FUNG|nr:hypothetical protein LPJ61_004982 [Coemansia biformis]